MTFADKARQVAQAFDSASETVALVANTLTDLLDKVTEQVEDLADSLEPDKEPIDDGGPVVNTFDLKTMWGAVLAVAGNNSSVKTIDGLINEFGIEKYPDTVKNLYARFVSKSGIAGHPLRHRT